MSDLGSDSIAIEKRSEQQASPAAKSGDSEANSALPLGRSGVWMPVDELKTAALQALTKNKNIVFNLSGLTHLDAEALQILLCVQKQQQGSGLGLQLRGVSSDLMHWFEVSGSSSVFQFDDRQDG